MSAARSPVKAAQALLFACVLALSLFAFGSGPAYAASPYRGKVVNCTTVNVRSGPGTGYSRLGKAKKGQVLTVLSPELYKTYWYKVSFKGKTGYIHKKYLSISIAGETKMMGTVVNCRQNITVRSAASSDAAALGTAAKGTKYAVLGTSGNFYKILYNGKTGYVSKTYIKTAKAAMALYEDVKLTVASFNVKCLRNGDNASAVAAMIKASGADVVGIQEIDQGVSRSGKADWPAKLAELSGYPYYCFAPSIHYGGGLYGTMILSRRPIIEASMTPLTVSSGEARVLAYARVLTSRGAVNVFNTHLSYGSDAAVAASAASFAEKLAASGKKQYMVTGDFNTTPDVLSPYVPGLTFADTGTPTYGRGDSGKIIDNVLYTSGITLRGVSVRDAVTGGVSDHDMVVAALTVAD